MLRRDIKKDQLKSKISLSLHKLKMKYTPIDIPLSRNFFDFKEIIKSIKFFFEQLKK